MKLVFLSKRRPMGRDLIEQPYGRFFHLPSEMARRGHEVHIVLLSYENETSVDLERDDVHWIGHSVFELGGLRYIWTTKRLVESVRPDWIIGFSDTYYGILAEHLARRYRTSSLIDAYDNYEGYLPRCKPLHYLWRMSLRRATAISAAGPGLRELMERERLPGTALVVPMAPDPLGFVPLRMRECRGELGLPLDAKLVGYAGAIFPNRGVDALFRAVDILKSRLPEVRLVLSGRVHRSIQLPADAIWMGYLPDDKMPALLNSLNVLAVVNRRSAFGDHSYPIKLYEAMSCQVPLVATRTPATEWILQDRPELLAAAGDADDLARRIASAFSHERIEYAAPSTWQDVAGELEAFLTRVASTTTGVAQSAANQTSK